MLPFHERCRTGTLLILDGATGTELARRGVDITGPAWTAAAILESPAILLEVHRDYVAAGAEVVTANTFRTHTRNLASIGLSRQARHLTHQAVQLAREAMADRGYVAGSAAPLGDCYTPEQTPDQSLLLGEHRRHAEHLADAGVDLILVETQVTIGEAWAAARAARETGRPFFVSFVCGGDGRLLSGEWLSEGFEAVWEWSPQGLLVNCLPAPEVERVVPLLTRYASRCLIGAYANTGRMDSRGEWSATGAAEPAVYAGLAAEWVREGLQVVGGCCGTTPEHISCLCQRTCGNRSASGGAASTGIGD